MGIDQNRRGGLAGRAGAGAVDRRGFFRSMGGASALAATAVVSPFAAEEAAAYDSGAEERRARYRETEHVKAYYRSNGYETLKK